MPGRIEDGLYVVSTLVRAGVIPPGRPDRALRAVVALQRWGPTLAAGYLAAGEGQHGRIFVGSELGQRLRAIVVLEDGASATEHELQELVRANLARYKVPREVVFVDALPRNATGKVLKRHLSRPGELSGPEELSGPGRGTTSD